MKTSLTLGIGDERARRPHPTGAELYAQNIVCVGSNYFRLTGQIHSIMLCSLEQIHSIKAVVGFGASYS